jgi:hypothetical protein
MLIETIATEESLTPGLHRLSELGFELQDCAIGNERFFVGHRGCAK